MQRDEKLSKKIKKLFHRQLFKISDTELAEKVVKCWVEAVKQSDYLSEFEEIPFTLALDGKKTDINLIEHTIAITEAVYAMAEAEKAAYEQRESYTPVNLDYLIASGLLHDVGKLIEIEPDGKGYYKKSNAGKLLRHPGYGAAIAYSCGIPDEILNTIANHSKEGEGRTKTKETRLIEHADFAFFESIKEPFE